MDYFFFILFLKTFFNLCAQISFQIYADDYVEDVKVNGDNSTVQITFKEPCQYTTGTLEAEEGDIIEFLPFNVGGFVGFSGYLYYNDNTFVITYSSHLFVLPPYPNFTQYRACGIIPIFGYEGGNNITLCYFFYFLLIYTIEFTEEIFKRIVFK